MHLLLAEFWNYLLSKNWSSVHVKFLLHDGHGYQTGPNGLRLYRRHASQIHS